MAEAFSDEVETENPKCILQSSDGRMLVVDRDAAIVSVTIRTMLEESGSGLEENGMAGPIPIPTVRNDILGLVIQWCTQHKVLQILHFLIKYLTASCKMYLNATSLTY